MPDKNSLETIRWNTKCLDEDEMSIIDAINTANKKDLPFDLPAEVKWPSKGRSKNDRAMLILRAGFESLKLKYQRKSQIKPEEGENNKQLKDDGWA